MIWRVVLIAVAAMALNLGGCKKEPAPVEPTPAVESSQTEITEENLNSELDKMEAEIEADIAAGQ